jgi:ubiquinone/menaquinone biosynthesis C-methylase UbiE
MSHPPNRLWRKLSNLYIHLLLPVIGGVYDREAYLYLSKSLAGFPDAPGLAKMFLDAGFAGCEYNLLNGGVAAIHLAVR